MAAVTGAPMSDAQAKSNKGKSLDQRRLWTSVHDQFKTIEILGQGTYGVVYKAENRTTGEIVAMKRCRLDAFKEFGIPETTLREIALLRDLRHENIVTLLHVSCNTDRLYLICEHLDMDLKKYIKSKPGGIPIYKVKDITYKLLTGLAFCHGHRVIHRDLKPHNVLLTDDGEKLKLADFGLARWSLAPGKTLTHEVITLWYRSPELLLGHCNYTSGVDIWSVGCIMAELLSLKPLYVGDSEIDTVFRIFRLLGTPRKSEWPEHAVVAWEEFPSFVPKPDPFGSLHPGLDQAGKNLLERIFRFKSDDRISAYDALQHAWFDELRSAPASNRVTAAEAACRPEYLDWQAQSNCEVSGPCDYYQTDADPVGALGTRGGAQSRPGSHRESLGAIADDKWMMVPPLSEKSTSPGGAVGGYGLTATTSEASAEPTAPPRGVVGTAPSSAMPEVHHGAAFIAEEHSSSSAAVERLQHHNKYGGRGLPREAPPPPAAVEQATMAVVAGDPAGPMHLAKGCEWAAVVPRRINRVSLFGPPAKQGPQPPLAVRREWELLGRFRRSSLGSFIERQRRKKEVSERSCLNEMNKPDPPQKAIRAVLSPPPAFRPRAVAKREAFRPTRQQPDGGEGSNKSWIEEDNQQQRATQNPRGTKGGYRPKSRDGQNENNSVPVVITSNNRCAAAVGTPTNHRAPSGGGPFERPPPRGGMQLQEQPCSAREDYLLGRRLWRAADHAATTRIFQTTTKGQAVAPCYHRQQHRPTTENNYSLRPSSDVLVHHRGPRRAWVGGESANVSNAVGSAGSTFNSSRDAIHHAKAAGGGRNSSRNRPTGNEGLTNGKPAALADYHHRGGGDSSDVWSRRGHANAHHHESMISAALRRHTIEFASVRSSNTTHHHNNSSSSSNGTSSSSINGSSSHDEGNKQDLFIL